MPLKTRTTQEATEAKKDEAVVKTEKEVVAASVASKATVAEVNQDILETKCDKVAFVCALGDPSRDDVTPANPEKGIEQRVDPTIVGFKFKALEDMDVPDCGIPANLRENNMDFVEDMINNTVHVKAGEEFKLTRFETGLLLSREEFNAKATGGEIPVGVTYMSKKKTTKSGATASVSSATPIPTVSLRPLKTGMSIKDVAMDLVMDFVSEKRENGTTRKIRTIKPGFEKWESLCKSASTAPRKARTTSPASIKRSQGAAVFMDVVNARK